MSVADTLSSAVDTASGQLIGSRPASAGIALG
jgi:hypothetical protein